MIRVLVLSHGELAHELLKAARTIDPHLEQGLAALALPWDADSDDACRMVKQELSQMQKEASGVLVLTDMFGGTATNLALPFLVPDKVEVVTGVNLPMLVKLASLRGQEMPLHELAERLMRAGQKSIHVASDFLRYRNPVPAKTAGDGSPDTM